jgi:hypothetical protein
VFFPIAATSEFLAVWKEPEVSSEARTVGAMMDDSGW